MESSSNSIPTQLNQTASNNTATTTATTGSINQLHRPRFMNENEKLLMYQLNQYATDKVTYRRNQITKTIGEIINIVQDILREVEIQEPRFISTLTECNGHFEGKSSTRT